MTYCYDEGLELYRYISWQYGGRYFPQIENILLNTLLTDNKRYRTRRLAESRASESDLRLDLEVTDKCSETCRMLMRQVAEAAVRDHGDKMHIPRCARCTAVLRTPIARQCVRCGHAWFQQPAR